MKSRKQFFLGLLTGVLLTAVLVIVGRFGLQLRKSAVQSTQAENGELVLTTSGMEEKLDVIQRLINTYYLDEIDNDEVESYLYKGVIAGLGDPYAAYYTAEEYQSMMDSTSGSYYGIGVEVSQNMNTGVITVVTVFSGTPAEEAGLEPGDILYTVDGTEVTGEDLNTVVSMIKGEENTTVEIGIVREGEKDTLTFQVERRNVEVPTVEYEMLEGNIGYIALSSFDDVTYAQFMEALNTLEDQGETALIVDLRNNGGGLVSSVCNILDELLPEGLIVYTEDKYGNREEQTSDAERCFDKPLAVLVNGNSASASEIFAGAIKDYGIGTIVGTLTYGKGIVQKIYPLGDGTAIKLTTSRYYTPNGNNIHGIGIEPDVEVERDTESRTDNQLEAAVEVIQEKLSQ